MKQDIQVELVELVDLEVIKNFIELNLIHLIDSGFDIKISDKDEFFLITIQKKLSYFKWLEVKDDFIPFIHILNIVYKLGNFILLTRSNQNEHLVKKKSITNLTTHWSINKINFIVNKV